MTNTDTKRTYDPYIFTLDRETKMQLEELAERLGQSRSAYLRLLIREEHRRVMGDMPPWTSSK